MSPDRQRTLRQPVQATGTGLHTGEPVRIRIAPAPPDTGIVFRRGDLAAPHDIPARIDYVAGSSRATTLEREGQRVGTVEHLLAAFVGLGVDNALVEVFGPEVPIMDGSAGAFVFLLQAAGIVEQAVPRRVLEIREPVEVRDGDRLARLEPGPGLEIVFEIEYDHPLARGERARAAVVVAPPAFVAEIARARTFGFAHELETLRAARLIRGGTLGRALLLDDRGVVNPEGLRWPDELVRHKILDAIGDLALLGLPIRGRYLGRKAGHALNHRLLRAVLEGEGRVVSRVAGSGEAAAGLAAPPLASAAGF
ncbi:MAG: UDP-3-O-acyl-N-acetylglucosamine deacetylase [Xanthomonadales bacterium]|nr:UDP-3-O-acyl-N-acetylglucosamine deacetylase [Xanthomonadales bacterium]